MFTKVETYWNYGNCFQAIEHISFKKGEAKIFGLQGKKINEEFEVVDQFIIEDIKNPKKKYQTHSYLNISGSQVIVKTIPQDVKPEQAFTQCFPSINQDEFYFQVLEISGHNYISVCRRLAVDAIIEEFEKSGILILGISLAFFPITKLLPYLKSNLLELNYYKLNIEGESILNFSCTEAFFTKTKFPIDGELINVSHLVSLGLIYNYFSITQEGSSNITELNQNLEKTYKGKIFFENTLKLGVGFLLCLLLINFFFYSKYHSEFQLLNEKNQSNLALRQQNQALRTRIKVKQEKVDILWQNGNSKSIYFVNRVVASIPPDIELTSLNYQPLAKAIKEKKPIEFFEKQILIEGLSKNKMIISDLIRKLNDYKWIKVATLKSYSSDDQSNAIFVVEIEIKEE